MRIDAHQHVWDLAVRDQPWTAQLPSLHRDFAIADLAPALLAHAMDATVLVQTISVAAETPELIELARTDRWIAGVVGWVELTGADVAQRLAELRGLPGGEALVGIRHQVQGEADPRWLCRPEVRRGLATVGEAGLAYDLLVTSEQLPAAVEIVRDLPGVRFVLDHAGKPPISAADPQRFERWRAEITELAALPNVAVKLSGLVTEADHQAWTVEQLRPWVATLLDTFGPSRIMFGSDWPVCLLAAGYDDVIAAAELLTSELSQLERAEVFGTTAAHWYRLPRYRLPPRDRLAPS